METLADLSPEVRNANPLAVGTRLQEFVIERVIGIGGFGIVYQANDSLLRRSVAIKEYMPVSLAMRGEGNTVGLISASFKEDFDNGRRTFIEEARMLAQFKHPALIEVLRYWEDNRTAYMVTPFYSGRTLDDFLRKRAEPIQEAELRRILLPVLDALGHISARRAGWKR
jgi:serine/threonine protein kinase